MTQLFRWRSRLSRRVPVWSGGYGLAVLAVVVGAGAGLGAVGFRDLIRVFTRLFSGHTDYSALGRVANPHVPALGPWFLLLAPVVAGLVYGPLIAWFAPQARGHGVPEVMFAVAERGGRIPASVAVVKSLASALCIGAGGSVGREGPIVQIGSALGSTVGRLARLPEVRLRVLVACGAAGGIAATFNAPIAGVFFALELILGSFATEHFGAVVLAAVTASVVGRAILGNVAFLRLPPFAVHHPAEYALYVLLGLLGAAVGVGFTRVLYAVEDGCDRLWRGPEWLRPGVGGLLLGALLLALPEMYGVGYPVLGNGIAGRYTVGFLLLLLVGKTFATSLTIGIGGSGGVFAPSLFVGAMLGDAFGQVAHSLVPGVVPQPGAYALVGMAAVFAGAARAPITAVLILFELTGEYTIVLPLMLAVVVATAASAALSADTVYTLKLRRRGVTLSRRELLLDGRTAAEAATDPPASVRTDTPAAEVLARLATGAAAVPVLDPSGRFHGVVEAAAAEETLLEPAPNADAASLAVQPDTLAPDDPLQRALTLLSGAEGAAGVAVVDTDRRLTGWVTHQSLLRALGGRPAPGPAQPGPAQPSSEPHR